jgi:hypothetical protein
MSILNMTTLKTLLAASAVALLTVTAYAQDAGGVGGPGGGFGGPHRQQGKAKKAEAPKQKADEKAYSAALNELPNKQFDPWHGVR